MQQNTNLSSLSDVATFLQNHLDFKIRSYGKLGAPSYSTFYQLLQFFFFLKCGLGTLKGP